MLRTRNYALALVLASAVSVSAQESRPKVVAAENFYGDVAQQIGGNLVNVASIMSNPDQDPHLFEITPSVMRQISEAQIVVFNGAGYDPWMSKLLSAAPRSGRIAIDVAELVGKKGGDNPHIWYVPDTMKTVAKALARAFAQVDPAHAAEYRDRQSAFESSLAPIERKIEQMRARHGGAAVTATEPVFGDMAAALGLVVRNKRFQLSVMNDTEPTAHDIAAFEDDLKARKVKALIFNKQAVTNLTKRMLQTAQRANIPVVGVTETEPPSANYQAWMLTQLKDLQNALAVTSK